MSNTTILTTSDVPHRISWSALFSGALVGVGLCYLLQLFCVAVGLSAYQHSTMTIAIGGFIGLLIGIIVAMGIAGFVSGYLGRFYYCFCHGGVIYGFLTWIMTVLIIAVLFLPLTRFTAIYSHALGSPIVIPQHTLNASQPSPPRPEQEEVTQSNVPMENKALANSFWAIFVLLFCGAISTCVGSVYGMNCKKEHPPMH